MTFSVTVGQFWWGVLASIATIISLVALYVITGYIYFMLTMSGTFSRWADILSGRRRKFNRYIQQLEKEREKESND